ncbi:ParB/RepB/Spo0J family partition protein [Comamonas aquatica]|uniref:ParB/RepB/Spo0J family partition protein n=1 Tax=Comamonas aquatica TaxID=225991 RepID=UPI002448F3C0|nr:ParB/RepB/Spo0J family partition protein [Comamonas aquatica]MDH0897765.1 ParB/RepB/Spo0J family partition protein [Comamonas aquatica]
MTDSKDTMTQALPTPGAGAAFDHLAWHSITPSLTNPRKHFDQAALQDLADSIAATGVHQPILVRPLPAHRVAAEQAKAKAEKRERAAYEIVAGERRWRACGLANAGQVPAMIRDMTDAEALEAQVIENLQRTDITELEEAEGYQVLMQHQGINADQMGAKIGKSRAYVYGRLKVLSLCEAGRAALRAGTIDFSKALLAARIPSEKLQLEAIEYMTKTDWSDNTPSYRECANHVQQNYMLRLDKARFTITDASLLPKAGSCSDCSKRTGANPDLFSDVDSADVCTDRTCFENKTQAHIAQQVAAAKEKGQTVIVGEEAQELAGQHGYNDKMVGYRRLDTAEDSPTDQPLRKIIGKQMEAEGILPVKIESRRNKGELLDALPNDVVLRLLKAVEGQADASAKVSKEVIAFAEDKKAKAAAKAEGKYEQAWRNQLRDRTWEVIIEDNPADAFNLDVHRYLVRGAVSSLSTADAEAVAAILGLGKVGGVSALHQFAKDTPAPHLLHLLCVMQRDVSANYYGYGREKNEGLMLVARAVFGPQLQTVIKEEKHAAAVLHLPKPAPDNTDAPKSDLPLTPAARTTKDGGQGKAKGNTQRDPAALAGGGGRKLSAEAAAAGIAAALQAAAGEPEPGAAVAAQGNDAGPVAAAAAQAPGPLVTLKRSKPAKPAADTPAAGGTGESAVDGQDSADVKTGAAVKKAKAVLTAAELVGKVVRINANATQKKQKPWVDYEGTVTAQCGPEAVIVSIPRAKGCAPIILSFHVSELDLVAEQEAA